MDVSVDDEALEPPNLLTRGTLTAIGNIAMYSACPVKNCHFSKLLEDGRCRICHTKPESAADGLVANTGIEMRGTSDIKTMKISTATLQTFYANIAIKACCLVSAKPLCEPMLRCCQLNPRNELQSNFRRNSCIFIQENAFEKNCLCNTTIFSRP